MKEKINKFISIVLVCLLIASTLSALSGIISAEFNENNVVETTTAENWINESANASIEQDNSPYVPDASGNYALYDVAPTTTANFTVRKSKNFNIIPYPTDVILDPITWVSKNTTVETINEHDVFNTTEMIAASVGGVWQAPITLDSAEDVGEWSSIVICPAGNVHISYYDSTNRDLKYITRVGGVWQAPITLDSVGNVGWWPSIAICSAGNVHISYHEYTKGDLKYITRVGGVWQAPITLDSVGDVGSWSSIAICPADNLHISYFDFTNRDLKYITRVGGVWQAPITLDSVGYVGWSISIDICTASNVHISYYDWTNGNLKYITRVGGVWQAPITLDSVGIVGWYTSIATCPAGNVHISYYDWTNDNLKYITRVGGVWQAPIALDSVGIVGLHTSIDICPASNVHISYYDWTNGNLKYITRVGGVWQAPIALDIIGWVGWYTSIAICPASNVHISYHDETNGDLKYITNARAEPTPTGIIISPPTASVNVTEMRRFIATTLPAGANQSVTWSVTNVTGTGTIDATGLFRGISAGTVTVTARSVVNANIIGTATVTVVAPVGRVADLSIQPSIAHVRVGKNFTLNIQAAAGIQPVTGISAFLDFNPIYLEVVSIEPGATLSMVLQNGFNNTTGTIDYSAGDLIAPFPTGTFTVANITFRALKVSPATTIEFNRTLPRQTMADFGGSNVTGSITGTRVTVTLLFPGDTNGDGGVNIADFGILAASFMRREGEAGFDSRADFNRDGVVNIADFGIIAANFGR